MSRRFACRRVRDWLQDQHDREGAESLPAELTAAAAAAAAHLETCPDCRRFREFLSNYGKELAAALDALPAAVPQAARTVRSPASRLPAAWRLARHPAFRWALPAAAAALLAIAAGSLAPRLAPGARARRIIRGETASLVEELFSRPLAQSVESGLAGGSLLEGLGEGDGLQDLGLGEE